MTNSVWMESSAVLGSKFHHHILTHPSPSSFPIILSMSLPAPRAIISNPATATSTAATLFKNQSYLQRKFALLEVQNSSDLISSLQFFCWNFKAARIKCNYRTFREVRQMASSFSGTQNLYATYPQYQRGKTNGSSYSTYVKIMGKKLSPVKALEIYNSILDEPTRVNVFIANSLLTFMVRNDKFESSIKMFDKMEKDGLTPDSVTYHTLLADCIKIKHGHSKTLELIKELKYNGLQMDSVICGTLLVVCASNGLLRLKLFTSLRNPNLFITIAVIDGVGQKMLQFDTRSKLLGSILCLERRSFTAVKRFQSLAMLLLKHLYMVFREAKEVDRIHCSQQLFPLFSLGNRCFLCQKDS